MKTNLAVNRHFREQYSFYYQARVDRQMTWFFTGCLKSCDHVAFDRTIDSKQGIFEFFVPDSMVEEFLAFMQYFIDQDIVSDLHQKTNRLETEEF